MHPALIPADEIDDFVIIRVRAFARKVQRAILRDILADEDLPLLEWQLLFSVARFGSCHLAHVSAKTSIDPAHGSRAAAALEMRGLIERQEDPQNRRCKLISLTSDGRAVFDRIWPRAKAQMKSVTDQLDASDFKDFKRLLGLVDQSAELLDQDDTKPVVKTDMHEDTRIPV